MIRQVNFNIHSTLDIQLGSEYLTLEYSNHLNTRLVWYLNGRFVSSCQMVRYSNGGLKTGQKILLMVQNVHYLLGANQKEHT